MSVQSAFLRAGVPAATAQREAPLAEAAMRERGITNQARASMFLAQVLHESMLLRYFEEIASGSEYNGRADLGNIHPGDGPRYKGRGPIQLTGRANYIWAGKQLKLDLVNHPELASQHKIGWRIAALFWQFHGLNALADQGAFLTITERINGGTNGLASRQYLFLKVKAVNCKPSKPDPYAGLTKHERYLASTYDRLKSQNRDRARRLELRKEMRAQCAAIKHAGSLDKLNRRARLKKLEARS